MTTKMTLQKIDLMDGKFDSAFYGQRLSAKGTTTAACNPKAQATKCAPGTKCAPKPAAPRAPATPNAPRAKPPKPPKPQKPKYCPELWKKLKALADSAYKLPVQQQILRDHGFRFARVTRQPTNKDKVAYFLLKTMMHTLLRDPKLAAGSFNKLFTTVTKDPAVQREVNMIMLRGTPVTKVIRTPRETHGVFAQALASNGISNAADYTPIPEKVVGGIKGAYALLAKPGCGSLYKLRNMNLEKLAEPQKIALGKKVLSGAMRKLTSMQKPTAANCLELRFVMDAVMKLAAGTELAKYAGMMKAILSMPNLTPPQIKEKFGMIKNGLMIAAKMPSLEKYTQLLKMLVKFLATLEGSNFLPQVWKWMTASEDVVKRGLGKCSVPKAAPKPLPRPAPR